MPSQPDDNARADGGWLDGCIGFVVEAQTRRLGRLAELQRDADSGRPLALVVQGGIAGRRRLVVPVDEVVGVVPSRERIIVMNGSAARTEEQALPMPVR